MLDNVIIVAYLLITLVVGLYCGRNTKTMYDFAVAGKSVPSSVLVATTLATVIGGGSTLGLTEKVFGIGFIYVVAIVGDAFAMMFMAYLTARRIDQFANMISVGDIMGSFYGKVGKVLTGIAGTILGLGLVGAQVGAMGYLLHFVFDISQTVGILISCGVVVVYAAFGGIRAVIATDIIQFVVLVITIPMIMSAGFYVVGGYEGLMAKLPSTHLQFFPEGESKLKYIGIMLAFWLPLTQPAIFQRMLMAKNASQVRFTINVAAILEILCFIVVGIIGLLALAITPGTSQYLALPNLVEAILPVGLRGLAIAGMLAIMMSSADSFLNSAGVNLVHDVIKPLLANPISDRNELKLTKFLTFVLGVLAITAAISFDSILDLILHALDIWGPIVIVPLVARLLGFKTDSRSFVVGAVLSMVVFAFWSVFDLSQSFGMAALVPSILASALGFFATSYCTYKSPYVHEYCD